MSQPKIEQLNDNISDDTKDLGKKTAKGVMWTLAEMLGNHGVSFIVTIFLARLLEPKDFGIVGLATVFFNIVWAIIDGGFRITLIRKKSVSSVEYNTVFYTNLTVAAIVYAIIYFAIAPIMAKFYNEPQLIDLIRLLGLTFIFSALYIIQEIDLRRKMNFKALTVITIPAGAISGIIAIALAYKGFGAMSLAIKIPLHYFLIMLLYWFINGWRPKLQFSTNAFKELTGSGIKYMISKILNAVYRNMNPLVIGKMFSAQILGYFSFSDKIITMSSGKVLLAVEKVSLSSFSKVQDDSSRLLKGYKQLLKNTTALVFPLMVILAVMATPLFTIFLNVKWLPAIPYLRIMCITGVLQPILLANMNMILVKGSPTLYSKINVFSFLSLGAMLFILLPFGIETFLIGQVFHSAIMIFISNFFSSRLITYSVWRQCWDIATIVLSAAIMGFIAYLLMSLFENINLLQMGLLLISVGTVYIFVLWILRVDMVTKQISTVSAKLWHKQ